MNGDGHVDLIWQHSTTGQVVAWHLNGAGVRTSFAILVSSNPATGFRRWAT
jgi:hypothetical protein